MEGDEKGEVDELEDFVVLVEMFVDAVWQFIDALDHEVRNDSEYVTVLELVLYLFLVLFAN